MDRARWRSVVVVPCGGWLRDRLGEEGIEVVVLHERGSFDVAFLSRVTWLSRIVGADLIHSHLFGSAVRAGLVARIRGIPAMGTIHGQVDIGARERFRTLKLGIVRRGLRAVVFVSEPLRQSCLGSMGLDRSLTSVINNGVDADLFTPGENVALRASLRISPQDFVVGCVGRLQPIKGIATFLEAAAILKTASPDYRFVIVGDGDDQHTRELKELRDRLGLTDEVVFAGFRADVNEVMRAFDVYALTSHSEGFSLSTIEAMASGVPVVATRCGGPEQILQDGQTGLLVENGSALAVAKGIERLRVNPDERRRVSDAARQVVLTRYTVDAQVRAYEELYERLLRRGQQDNTESTLSFAR
jgi:glycosyltransferase involved in cell wall biosynthesis